MKRTFQTRTQSNSSKIFNEWALRYDREVIDGRGFPFEGYEAVLDAIVQQSGALPGMEVRDLGTGTGNLTSRFVVRGCKVWGVDFALEMLRLAREKFSTDVTLVQADLLGDWPASLERRFDCIVSAYVFHEFDPASKINLLEKLASDHLIPGGRIVIGDIAFQTQDALAAARKRWKGQWDEEYYWVAEKDMLAPVPGMSIAFQQISFCAGVFTISLGVTPDS
jgi:putative AdoMet-dependent methyltransferase